MSTNPDRCTQLRKLHAQLTNQVKVLRESIQKAEKEGADTSIETLNSMKHLQASLHNTSLELEKCPPDPNDAAAAATQQQVKVTGDIHRWFPEEEVIDEDDQFESVVDEP